MNDDPFDFDDRTILRSNKQPSNTWPAQSESQEKYPNTSNDLPLLGGINPLEQAASKLLALLIGMNGSSHQAPDQLREQLIQELEKFKLLARDALNDAKQVTEASYIMCTVLDEAAMNTPWGHRADWSQYNLLSTFHDEVTGGERFFTLLKVLGKNPSKNIHLLELMYICLALGFQGSYRLASNGNETLQKVRLWLYDIIQNERSAPSPTLSAHWQGSSVTESRLPKMTPVWVGLVGSLAVASVIYVSLLFNLSDKSENTVSLFSSANAAPLKTRTITPPAQSFAEEQNIATLTDLLTNEIEQGQLSVIESFDRGVIRLVGDSLFGAGSAKVGKDAVLLINRTASVLNDYSGSIIIVGFSDNTPIRSAPFPSNLELSKARAESVSEILSESMDSLDRLSSEGRGSLDPIGDNATAEGRRMNRRVEITVYY